MGKVLSFLCQFLFIFTVISSGIASDYQIIRLTNGPYDAHHPEININGHVTWCGRNSTTISEEIFYYDGSDIIRLTNNSYPERFPQINNNNHVVWYGGREGSGIYLYDGTLVNKISNSGGSPYINNNGHIVWFDDVTIPQQIFLYDGFTTNQISNLSGNSSYPKISGNGYVFWECSLNNIGYEIFLYDGSTVNRLTNDSYKDGHPFCNNNGWAVWTKDYGSYLTRADIFYYNGSGIIQLTNNDSNRNPVINDNGYIAWERVTSEGSEVVLFDGSSITQISNNVYDSVNLIDINNNNKVVWSANYPAKVFLYDGTDTTQITDNSYSDTSVKINDNDYIVWVGYTSPDHDVFLAVPVYPPMANAGIDQSAYSSIMLDGSQSNDTDGSIVLYEWLLEHRDDSAYNKITTGEKPTVTDLEPGIYDVTLTVTDNDGLTDTDTMVLTVLSNVPPIANSGLDQTVHIAEVVVLNGSGSADPDEDYPLSYAWEIISLPEGSLAELDNPESVSPSFTPDSIGDYIIQLIVTDSKGLQGNPDTVIISTVNTPPVADAGPDQAIIVIGSIVQLDGIQSYDNDGDFLDYQWSMKSMPEGSTTVLIGEKIVNPIFVADVQGDYVIELIVSDIWSDSEPDEVVISFDNVMPIANAGGNQAVIVGETIELDGTSSSDANNDPLTYSWSFISVPDGSTAVIGNTTLSTALFVADIPGEYIVSLVVNDGFIDSEPTLLSNITIVAITIADAITSNLQEEIVIINSFDDNQLKNRNMKNALTNKINNVIELVNQGLYQDALDKLVNDILKKTNGCFEIGEPDNNDWITDCDAQNEIYPFINEVITMLGELI